MGRLDVLYCRSEEQMPSKLPLVHLVIPPNLTARIDDFRFAHRFGSRAAAIKFLLTWALEQEPGPGVTADQLHDAAKHISTALHSAQVDYDRLGAALVRAQKQLNASGAPPESQP